MSPNTVARVLTATLLLSSPSPVRAVELSEAGWIAVADAYERVAYLRPSFEIESLLELHGDPGELTLDEFVNQQWEEVQPRLDRGARASGGADLQSTNVLRRALSAHFLQWLVAPDSDGRRLRELAAVFARRTVTPDDLALHHLVGGHLALADRDAEAFTEHLRGLMFDVILTLERRSAGSDQAIAAEKIRLFAENLTALYLIDAAIDAEWAAINSSAVIPFLLRHRVSFYAADLGVFLARMEGPTSDGPNPIWAVAMLAADQVDVRSIDEVDLANPEHRRQIAALERALLLARARSVTLKGRIESLAALVFNYSYLMRPTAGDLSRERLALAERVADALNGPVATVLREAIEAGRPGGDWKDSGFARREDLVTRAQELLTLSFGAADATAHAYFTAAMKSPDSARGQRLLDVVAELVTTQLATFEAGLKRDFKLPASEYAYSAHRAERLGRVYSELFNIEPTPALLARRTQAFALAAMLCPLRTDAAAEVYAVGFGDLAGDPQRRLRNYADELRRSGILAKEYSSTPEAVSHVYQRLTRGRSNDEPAKIEETLAALRRELYSDAKSRAHWSMQRIAQAVSEKDVRDLLESVIGPSRGRLARRLGM